MTSELQVFSEFKLASLPDKERASAVGVLADRIYVGTKTGRLLSYQFECGHHVAAEQVGSRQLSKSKKPVKQVCAVEELGIVVALAGDGKVVSVDPGSLDPTGAVPTSKRTSGADLICVSQPGDPRRTRGRREIRLCVASGKTLSTFVWSDSAAKFEFHSDRFVPRISDLVMVRNTMCLAFKDQYQILDTSSSDPAGPCPVVPDPKTTPSATLIDYASEKAFLLLAQPDLAIAVALDGSLAKLSPITFSGTPTRSVQTDFYLCSLIPSEGCVEVFSLLPNQAGKRVQRLAYAGDILAPASPGSGRVVVSDGASLSLLVMAGLEQQARALLRLRRVEEGIQLLCIKEPPLTQLELREFQAEAGFVLFKDLQFAEAMNYFEASCVDPREILYLFPGLTVPQKLPYDVQHPSNPRTTIDALVLKGMRERSEQRLQKLKQRQRGAASGAGSAISALVGLGGGSSSSGGNSSSDKNSSSASKDLSVEQHMRRAHMALARFLWKRRTDPPRGTEIPDEDFLPALDTALLYLWVDLLAEGQKPPYDAVDDLLLPRNSCLTAECAGKLLCIGSTQGHGRALGYMYHSRGQTTPALETWKRLGTGEYRDGAHDGVRDSVAVLSQEPDGTTLYKYAEWVLLKNPKEGMKIFTSDSRVEPLPVERVLAELERVQSVLESPEQLERALPRPSVSGNMMSRALHAVTGRGASASVSPSASSAEDPDDPDYEPLDLVSEYLEHLIFVLKRDDYQLHTQYALRTLQRVTKLAARFPLVHQHRLRPGGAGKSTVAAANPAAAALGSPAASSARRRATRARTVHRKGSVDSDKSFTARGAFESDDELDDLFPGDEPGALGRLRTRLVNFLRRSDRYDRAELLRYAKPTDLHDEKAVLYARMGQDRRCLDVLLRDLRQFERAQDFCFLGIVPFADAPPLVGHGGPGLFDPDRSKRFLLLLELLLRPSEPVPQPQSSGASAAGASPSASSSQQQQMQPREPTRAEFEDAMTVCVVFYKEINPVKVLALLPEHFSIDDVHEYFEKALPHVVHVSRHLEVVKGLSTWHQLQTEQHLRAARARRIEIDDETSCCVCDGFVGNKTFVAYPNDVIVHYQCKDKFENNRAKYLSRSRRAQLRGGGGGGGVRLAGVGGATPFGNAFAFDERHDLSLL